jgi:hypothetical protein
MKDPWNPTPAELEAWAYEQHADDPVDKDWDLIATSHATSAMCLKLASDVACPKRFFFLWCLYLFVGDAYRTQYRESTRTQVQALVASVAPNAPAYIGRWAERTRLLLAGKSVFSYEAWCGGDLARAESLACAG